MMEDCNVIESDADKELKGLRKYTNEKKKPVDEIVSSMMSAVEKM